MSTTHSLKLSLEWQVIRILEIRQERNITRSIRRRELILQFCSSQLNRELRSSQEIKWNKNNKIKFKEGNKSKKDPTLTVKNKCSGTKK